MVGNRDGDFLRANREAGLLNVVKAQGLANHKPPEGYTWHHRDDFKPNPNPPPLGVRVQWSWLTKWRIDAPSCILVPATSAINTWAKSFTLDL
jgi:hypothetical protein